MRRPHQRIPECSLTRDNRLSEPHTARTPVANTFAERWIGSIRRELLDRTIIWNRQQLERLVVDYITHHNQHRPHQSHHQFPQPGLLERRALATIRSTSPNAHRKHATARTPPEATLRDRQPRTGEAPVDIHGETGFWPGFESESVGATLPRLGCYLWLLCWGAREDDSAAEGRQDV